MEVTDTTFYAHANAITKIVVKIRSIPIDCSVIIQPSNPFPVLVVTAINLDIDNEYRVQGYGTPSKHCASSIRAPLLVAVISSSHHRLEPLGPRERMLGILLCPELEDGYALASRACTRAHLNLHFAPLDHVELRVEALDEVVRCLSDLNRRE